MFLGAALLWIFLSPVSSLIGLPLNNTMNAIVAALILFGGGLALASGFSSTGLAEWFGSAAAEIRISTILLVLVVTIAIVYLTEITSKTASTATFLPIPGAVGVGVHDAGGDAPNAIVFSYDKRHVVAAWSAG